MTWILGINKSLQKVQSKEVTYEEWLKLAMQSGVSDYSVFITGHQCSYYGRKGEVHVEKFPQFMVDSLEKDVVKF